MIFNAFSTLTLLIWLLLGAANQSIQYISYNNQFGSIEQCMVQASHTNVTTIILYSIILYTIHWDI